jgi:NADH:ubiquinone reductase (non-electrogenic)
MLSSRNVVAAAARSSVRPSVGPRQLAVAVVQRRALSQASTEKPRLVILGTGWGSFRVLKDLDARKFDVSVVSPRNHLLFTPMLASSALGTVNQRSICQPVRPVVASQGAKYYESSVKTIDKENKELVLETTESVQYRIPYDLLVIGVGYQPNDFNTPGVREHALFMKETADATRFKDVVLEKFEKAINEFYQFGDRALTAEEETKLKETLTFVVVGGGPTGVELAGELTDFLHDEGAKMYKELQPYVRVHMFTYDVLNTFSERLQETAIQHLKHKQKVEMHLNTFVTKVTEDEIFAKRAGEEFSMKYGTMVWCAGIKPHNFVRDFGCQMNERGTQILADSHLHVKGEKDIWALGDCCTIQDYWLPQTAQVANQQGQYLAKSLGEYPALRQKPFAFSSKGMMAYIGGFNAVMGQLPFLNTLTGFVAFLGWRFTYWFLQLSVRNRFMLLTDWLRTLCFGRDLTRFGRASQPQ